MVLRNVNSDWVNEQVTSFTEVRPRYKEYTRALHSIIRVAIAKIAPLAIIQTRTKTISSFTGKVLRKGYKYSDPISNFTDICGARVILQTRDQIEPMCNYIKEHFVIDWENSYDVGAQLKENEFGYRSLHYIISLERGRESNNEFDFKIPDGAFPDEKAPMKAEIQIRTMLEHAWAEYSHDVEYKCSYNLPRNLKRQLAQVSALLESADEILTDINASIQTYATSYEAYMSNEEIKAEMDILGIILQHSPDDFPIAYKLGKLAITTGNWSKAIDVLSKFANSGYQPILRDLGFAYTQLYRSDPSSKEYRKGQTYLQKSIQLFDRDVDAISILAGSFKKFDGRKAESLYRQAFEIDPGDPYVLGNCIEYEIIRNKDASVISLLKNPISEAADRCVEQAEVGSNYPWAFYDMGKFNLLLGRENIALLAYLKAIQYSTASFMLDTSLKSIINLETVIGRAKDSSIKLLNLGKLAKFSESMPKGKVADRYDKTAKKLDGPIVIVAGSCSQKEEQYIQGFREIILDSFHDYHGTIISGGTRSGISGFVGEIQTHYPDRIKTIGYIPSKVSLGTDIDSRYSEIRKTEGIDFSEIEPIQYWIDIFASGIDPKSVRLLGIGGATISTFEYMLAITLGARVVILDEPREELESKYEEILISDLKEMILLPAEKYIVRSFVGTGSNKLPDDIREKLARYIHANYRLKFTEKSTYRVDAGCKWEDLPDELKESNRLAVDHIVQKFSEIGYKLEMVDDKKINLLMHSDEDLEIMAQMEHARWIAERIVNGWSLGQEKDFDKKTHPMLVPWDELDEAGKNIDRTQVKNLPWFLSEFKIKIVKK